MGNGPSINPQDMPDKIYDGVVNTLSVDGKTLVITGTTSGTGFHACRAAAKKGAAKIIMLNRKSPRADKALADLKSEHPSANFVQIECDLSNFESVRKVRDKVRSDVADSRSRSDVVGCEEVKRRYCISAQFRPIS